MLTYASLCYIHRAEAQVSARQVEEQALRDAGGAYAYAGRRANALYYIHRAEAQVSARQVEEQALRDAGGAYAYAGGAAGAAAAPEARASDVRLSWKYSQVCVCVTA
jgi:hypothetical protein